MAFHMNRGRLSDGHFGSYAFGWNTLVCSNTLVNLVLNKSSIMKLILLLLFSLHVAGEEIMMLDELGPYLNQSLETAECRTHCLEFTVPRTFRACWDTCSLLNSKVQVKSLVLFFLYLKLNILCYKVNTIQECKHNKSKAQRNQTELDKYRVSANKILQNIWEQKFDLLCH